MPSNVSPPRYGTLRRPERPTFGHEVEAWHFVLSGTRFMPHQRYIADVATEYELVELNGVLHARLCYDLIIIIIPRQEGKTTLVEALMTWASRRGHDRTVIYTAQDRQMARARLLDEYEAKRLARSTRLVGRYKARRSNGSESIRWVDRRALGSKIVIVATTDDAGHGLTTDLGVLDEAWAHRDLSMVSAIQPTMVTRFDPQLWIVSTVGEGLDGLLLHYEEIGEASLLDPDTTVAVFNWSATEDDDRLDPAVWARVMPALGRTITPERIRSYALTMPVGEFDRSFLCRRPDSTASAKIPAAAWSSCRVDELDPAGPYVAAVAVALDRSHTTIAVAGVGPDERVAVVVDRRAGTTWAAAALADLNATYGPHEVYGDRRAGAGGILDEATARGVPVVELGATDVVDNCSSAYDLIVAGRLAHAGQAELDVAATHAVERPLGDAWAFSMRSSEADIAPLYAVVHAAGGHHRLWPTGVGMSRIV